jgi:tetratricopeptide (TPR) repeat protein
MILSMHMEERELRGFTEKALSLVQEHNTLDALFYLDKIIDQTEVPEVLSAYGLCIALERGKVKEGIDFCIDAINKDLENSFHYLNLGKVYLKSGKRAVSIDVFRKGLKFNPSDEHTREITEILNDLGLRKSPVLPFLPREHFLNKYLGLLLCRLRLR